MKKADSYKFVFIVGDYGPEHNEILSIHKTYPGAFKAWNKLRLELLKEARHMFQFSKDDAKKSLERSKWGDNKPFTQDNVDYFKEIAERGDEMYYKIIANLSCEDPKKIDNYPQHTPYIHKEKVKD